MYLFKSEMFQSRRNFIKIIIGLIVYNNFLLRKKDKDIIIKKDEYVTWILNKNDI